MAAGPAAVGFNLRTTKVIIRPNTTSNHLSGLSFRYPFLIQNRVIDDRATVRGVDDVDFAVAGLDSERVGVVEIPDGEVAAMPPGLVAIGRERDSERRSVIHAIVVDQDKVAVL